MGGSGKVLGAVLVAGTPPLDTPPLDTPPLDTAPLETGPLDTGPGVADADPATTPPTGSAAPSWVPVQPLPSTVTASAASEATTRRRGTREALSAVADEARAIARLDEPRAVQGASPSRARRCSSSYA
jgi:hypothetical protein